MSTRLARPIVRQDGSDCRISVTAESTRWLEKELTFTCREDGFDVGGRVVGHGEIGDCRLLGGWLSTAGGPKAEANESERPRSSRPSFESVFSPEPSAPPQWVYRAYESTSLDVWSEPYPARGHWFFTPPPFCYVLGRDATTPWGRLPEGPLLALGLAAAPGEHNFTGFHYEGSRDGFTVRLPYDAQTRVDGAFDTPVLLFLFGAADPYEAIARHTAELRERGLAEPPVGGRADWWARPSFCGWGEQCYLAREAAEAAPRAMGVAGEGATVAGKYWRSAPNFSGEHHYDRFIDVLGDAGLNPGTVVIDDKWQLRYALPEPDPTKWPDLRAWIDRAHDRGQRVLLWWNAWAAEGLPAEETVRDGDGRPVTCDPSNPTYRARLTRTVADMLGADGLDADGLKVDLTASTPHGAGFSHHGPQWGVELLRTLLDTIHTAAKRAKPDALIVTHTPNAYFASVTDAIRLNDMARLEDAAADASVVREMAHRARVARAACPELSIDTDGWPLRTKAAFREYVRAQPELGVPALYHATHIDVSREPLEDEDYALIRASWAQAAAR